MKICLKNSLKKRHDVSKYKSSLKVHSGFNAEQPSKGIEATRS